MSLEEEMAKFEETNCLDTSIECESLGDKNLNENKENLMEMGDSDAKESGDLNKILLKALACKQNEKFDIELFKKQINDLQSDELFKLMAMVNETSMRIFQINNLILERMKSNK